MTDQPKYGFFMRLRIKYHERRLIKIRNTALKYIGFIHKTMIAEGYTRHKRKQFWREFVAKGRFEE